MLKSKDIELYKTWSEYTDEEKKLLPPLDPELIKNGNVNICGMENSGSISGKIKGETIWN